ncbi:MAG: nucleoside-diphosphate-sugar epimerase [Paracoccaceae bacterium]|jgi:nucleoside-diphosphate-sugar epimerase
MGIIHILAVSIQNRKLSLWLDVQTRKPTMTPKPTILILGATGRFGQNGVIAFRKAGWNVRTFDREHDDLMNAANGADVILNGWNPPYTDWAKQVPELTKRVIAAAKTTGATVIVPGNVYVFGTDAPQNFSSTTPQTAKNELGQIRTTMEAAYRAAGVRTIVLRAGDFLDTHTSGNWFDLIMVKKLNKGVFTYPGNPEIPHAWAYLPDLLRAAVMLAEKRDALAAFEDVPFPGYTLTGQELHNAVENAAGHSVKLRRMNWLPIRLIAPVMPMMKRLVEMSYLWNKPHQLDSHKFNRLLPNFQATPLDAAIASAVSFNVDPNKAMVGTHAAV